uniref:Uncharacterized protein n=1 Tax=Plectus sambesii TaxID=2011161 RepID=A0A914V0D4_9BILA
MRRHMKAAAFLPATTFRSSQQRQQAASRSGEDWLPWRRDSSRPNQCLSVARKEKGEGGRVEKLVVGTERTSPLGSLFLSRLAPPSTSQPARPVHINHLWRRGSFAPEPCPPLSPLFSSPS